MSITETEFTIGDSSLDKDELNGNDSFISIAYPIDFISDNLKLSYKRQCQ